MWPVLFKIGGFEIGTFGLMVAIGFFAGYTFIIRRAAQAGYPEDQMANFIMLCLLAGLLGAKALHVVVNFHNGSMKELLFSRRGLVFYGGLLAGVPAGWWMVRRKRWNPREVADLIAPAIPLGEFFGRIGCFLNGCCFGKVCHSTICVRFPRVEEDGGVVGSDPFVHQWAQGLIPPNATHSLPVYPTQLFSSFSALLTFLFLTFFLSSRTRFKGQLALAYLLIYSVCRFTIEAFRDDPRGFWPGGLSTSQGISILVALFAAVLWIPLSRYKETP
jgi:phosphatidylglycerol:prolipoprotein diacylglycerol transferase